jgi:hypothetical protein
MAGSTGLNLIQVLGRAAPGRWWSVYVYNRPKTKENPRGRYWVGVVEGDNPRAEIKRQWPRLAKDCLAVPFYTLEDQT